MGRFTTPDPSRRFNPADPRSLNQYSYTGGDPINSTDRSGLYWELLGCEDAGYLDAESEIAGIPWRNCYYTSVDDEFATGLVQRPRIRRGGGARGAKDYSKVMIADKGEAQNALKYAVEHLVAKCREAFNEAFSDRGGYEKLKSGTKDITFWDARAGRDGEKLASDIVAGAPSETLASLMRFNNGMVLEGDTGISN